MIHFYQNVHTQVKSLNKTNKRKRIHIRFKIYEMDKITQNLTCLI